MGVGSREGLRGQEVQGRKIGSCAGWRAVGGGARVVIFYPMAKILGLVFQCPHYTDGVR